MNVTMCSRCNKNVAVVFITKIENGVTTNEGICLKCARDLGLKPVDDIMQKMGITDEELDSMSDEMSSLMENGGLESLPDDLTLPESDNDDENNENPGNTATFPFLKNIFGNPPTVPGNPEKKGDSTAKNQKKDAPSKKKFLDQYCLCLTQRARDGKLDRIVGRDTEIARVIQILNRRQKNNPCLIGEPGVGKTAIAEGLAVRIAEGNVPVKLAKCEVYLLDLTSLVAGTQFRGQFESRMKGLIDEVKKLGNIILVIDEVHNLMAAGDAEGAMNAANILKPALSRGEIQVIGATTFAEYRKHIEKDSALERRFQPVVVSEPSIEDSVKIITGIRSYYEDYHVVKIPDDIARQCVVLSERYITDRYLPDKAIDLMDEACSDINLHNTSLTDIENVRSELNSIAAERDTLMADTSNTAYEHIAELRSRELQLESRLHELETAPVPTVTLSDLARVIELWTGIPANRICEQEFERLSKLEDRLRKRIVGQDEAIASVASAIKRNRVGISAKAKPVSFIFTGSTGVGKTELVKRLAADMFDTPEALIRLDMSEFMEKHSVSRLIGAPPGYVGYDEAGQLTEKVRRRPYCVILFDEIEKAHPDVLNILLQILDDGRVTDAHGRTVSFEHTIIIMTSNAGSNRTDGAVGFARTVTEQAKEKALKALGDIMRPEFINRIDEIIAFNPLSRENFADIAHIMLGDLRDSLSERSIKFAWNDDAVDYLVDKSYSIKFGARNLQRLIQREIEDVIAAKLIDNYDRSITNIALSVSDGALKIDLL